MKQHVTTAAALGLALLAAPASAQTAGDAGGQTPAAAAPSNLMAALANTTQTSRSHSVPAGTQVFSVEGAACPADTRMLSGACHPGFSDQVIITNQFPNVAANTWRCGFKNNSGSARTVWVYTLCGEEVSVPPVVTHDIQASRFTTTPLTDADADRILGDATRVIQTDDGPNDIACNVALVRNGPVTAFSTGDGSIDSSGEFSAVIGLPGQAKAVNQINWCGGIAPNIIGCAPVPGGSFAIVRFTSNLEGILWLHEFGHNKGLSHRNGTDNVMHPSIGADRLGVNQAECDAFSVAAMLLAAAGPPMPQATPAAEDAPAQPPEDVRDFVRQHYVHGVPFEQASSYGPDAIPILLRMLEDPAEMEWWPNIVTTLGMIGEEAVVRPLIDFLEADTGGELPRPHYVAKSIVPMALGYVVNQSGSERALDYLISAADPAFWEDQDVGRAEFQASTQQRDFDLTTKAILGLALSGDPRAREALREMQTDAGGRMSTFQAQSGDLIDEALRENEAIEQQGLDEYYSGREPN